MVAGTDAPLGQASGIDSEGGGPGGVGRAVWRGRGHCGAL